MKNIIKLSQSLSKNSNKSIEQLIITRDRKTNKLCIYNSISNYKSEIAGIAKSRNNQYMFVRCLLYLRNYLDNVEYKCSVEEMEFITLLVAKKVWFAVDKESFDEQMGLVASNLAVVLVG